MEKLTLREAKAPTKGKAHAFVTAPKVDAYFHGEITWPEFYDLLRQHASFWAHESCKKVRSQGGYRLPAVGSFGGVKFAAHVPLGDPARARQADMDVVQVDWPDSWNVT